MMKRLFLFAILLVTTLAGVQGAEFYEVFDFSYSHGTPNDVYVTGGKCSDNDCSSLDNSVTVYEREGAQCFSAGSLSQFRNCIKNYKVNNGIVDSDGVIVKQNIPANHGYNTYFHTSQDAYLPEFFRTTNYNCNFDVCYATNAKEISFQKRPNAIAELQQLNIKNTDNDRLPIQVEIPVEIEETVCSAFEFTQPNMFVPNAPNGYADTSADTRVDLTVTRQSNNQELYSDAIEIPITADECRKMQTFTWTPPNSLENEEVKFRASSFVTDNQVSSSSRDFSEVIETIYPLDLTNACYTRAFDFTLSNERGTDLDTSIAEIAQGETLFASFEGQAYKGQNAQNPIDYRAEVFFDGSKVFQKRFTSQNGPTTHTIDLTDEISSLSTGQYEVKLVTTPLANGCTISEDVEQTQNLHLRAPEQFEVTFHVSDAQGDPISNAEVDFTLEDAADNFVNDPEYDKTQQTNTQGKTTFTDVYKGEYDYDVSKSDFNTVSNTLNVGANRDVYVTLQQNNVAPVVDLPENFTANVDDTIEIDLANFIADGDNSFSQLDITTQVTSGSLNLNRNGGILEVTSNSAQNAEIRVRAEDPQGAAGQDTTNIVFFTNEAPEITEFSASPDEGEVPLSSSFSIGTTDPESDPLTCTLRFGDGTTAQDNCDALDGISHLYDTTGTYTAELEVTDGMSTVTDQVPIEVFEQVPANEGPNVDSFTLQSSNGNVVPTELTLNWQVDHPQNLPTDCTLIINGNQQDVSCTGLETIQDYDQLGVGSFTIRAEDNDGKTDEETISRDFEESQGPNIDSFTLQSSNGNFVPTNLTLNWQVDHPQNLPTDCTLIINGGSSSVPCDGSRELSNYNLEGIGSFTIRAEDVGGNQVNTTITRDFERNQGPEVTNLRIGSSNGDFVPTDLTISWNARHLQGIDIDCELVINGNPQTVPCSGSRQVIDYNQTGTARITLNVEDVQGQSDIETITRDFERNQGPRINAFTLQSSEGTILPTDLRLNWQASHPQNLNIDCFLDVNGNVRSVQCTDSEQILDYTREGQGSFTFMVEDSQGKRESTTITRNFEENEGPSIDAFDLISSNGNFVPTNLTLNWQVSHDLGLAQNCSLIVNGNPRNVSCTGTEQIDNYAKLGVGHFIIKAVDSRGVSSQETITKQFRNPPVKIQNLSPELEIDETITPGSFTFQVNINQNENQPYRLVETRPEIICRGATNRLKGGPLSDDSPAFVSKEGGPVTTFTFRLDTLEDFKNQIPKDVTCEFKITLEDEFGDTISLSDSVIFSYPEEAQGPEASVRGRGTDVLNHMTTALNGKIERGYNSVDFRIKNVEDEGKELSISLMSTELGLNQGVTVNLEEGEETRVQVPVFIRKSTQEGMYPVRISVSSDDEKQVKYSYLQVPAQE